MERESSGEGPHAFDVLVLDAFNGDAVPLHLLTREAFQIYLDHLDSDGVLAVNVSNRYFEISACRSTAWQMRMGWRRS